MMDRRAYLLSSISLGLTALGGLSVAAPPDESILAALKKAVGPREKVAGMVAVTVDDGRTAAAAYGSSGVANVAMDGHAVFEIMSITKVMVAVLLADMSMRGEVNLDDPVSKYLPVTLHERGRPITLLDLATYTSGLPYMPGNLASDWFMHANDYSEAQLFEFLSSHVPKYEPGTHYEYANLGFAVLAIALARRADRSFEELLIQRICDPLNLPNTRITLTRKMRRRLVQGHDLQPGRGDLDLKAVPYWIMPAMLGMGSVSADAKDLTTFLEASMGIVDSPLRKPFARLLETQRPTSLAGTDAGLGWFITSARDEKIAWKSGLGGGCNTFIGFSLQRPRGAIVLSNFLWRPIDSGTINTGIKLIKPDFQPVDFNALYPFG